MPSLPPRDPGLRQVDEVVVDEEGQQREQQVPVARMARVRRRHADARAAACWPRRGRRPSAPDQLALVARASGRAAASMVGRARRRRGRPCWQRRRGRRPARGSSRSATASSRRCLSVLLVALAACSSTRKRPSPSISIAPAAGRGHGFDAAVRGDDEDVAAGRAHRWRVAFEEEGALRRRARSGTGPARRARGRSGARTGPSARRCAGSATARRTAPAGR